MVNLKLKIKNWKILGIDATLKVPIKYKPINKMGYKVETDPKPKSK